MCCDQKDASKETKTRRDFINNLAGGIAALAIPGPSSPRLGFASQEKQGGVLATVKIDEHQELQKPGGFVLVKKTPAGDLLVVRSGEAEYSAFSIVCPHLQCSVKVTSPTMIQCPCHKSAYGIDGTYISGPAKRGLIKFPISVESGVIQVMHA